MSRKPKPPALWKNSFFWFAAILLALGLWGLASGDRVIQDPGQTQEANLALLYIAGAVIMAINGWMTHAQAMKAYQDETDGE